MAIIATNVAAKPARSELRARLRILSLLSCVSLSRGDLADGGHSRVKIAHAASGPVPSALDRPVSGG